MSDSYLEGSEAIGKTILASNNSLAKNSSNDLVANKQSTSEIFFSEKENLKIIEEFISNSFDSEASQLNEIALYLLSLGGKRIRPMFCLLIARLCLGEDSYQAKVPDKLLQSAAGIEIIHMATLLHDDIIDQALTRRQSESAYSRFGQTPTLLTGDFLLVKAFGICARLEDTFVITETEKACIELTEGELLEGEIDRDRNVSLDEYYTIISKKTASLFALAGTIASYFTSTDTNEIKLMRQFGEQAGLLFQIVDDILDISVDKEILGKPGGVDLKQKVPTLINVLWLQNEPKKAREFFSKDSYTDSEIEQAKNELLNSKVFEIALNKTREHHKNTLGLLEKFSTERATQVNKEAKEKIKLLLDYTVSRIPNI